MRTNSIIRSLSYVLSSNLVVTGLGLVVMLVLPRLVGSVQDYGYWQIYYYYSSFFGLFLFGLNDGLNLLYAGTKFDFLNKKLLSTILSFIIFVISPIAILLSIISTIFITDLELKFVFSATALSILFLNISGFSMHVNQISLRFKQYSILSSLERVIFVVSFLPLAFLDLGGFKAYVFINLGIRFLVAVYGLYTIRRALDVSSIRIRSVILSKDVLLRLMRVGWPLTLGAICATLMGTSSRIVIERTMSVYDYGLFSLAFSFSLIVGIFVAAVPAVLYPALKRSAKGSHEKIFNSLYILATVTGAFAMSLSFLVPKFIEIFLPNYQPIVSYVSYLFPWMVYQLVSVAVFDVFYRLCRLEKRLFLNYLIGLVGIIAIQLWIISVYGDIKLMLLGGLLFYMAWVHACGIFLVMHNRWRISVAQFIDIFFTITFVVVNMWSGGLTGLSVYLLLWTVAVILIQFACSSDIKYIKSKLLARVK